MSEPQKQVSEVPLVAARPKRGNNLLTLLVLGMLIAVVSGAALYWIDPLKRKDDGHHTQWPTPMPHDRDLRSPLDHTAAVERMGRVATALTDYRDGPFGGGVRWPMSLDELKEVGLLEPEFDFTGGLSRRPLVYQPDVPMGYDPSRWIMVHDVEMGWKRTQTGRRVQAPMVALVILGDGTVRVIEDDEFQLYAGLTNAADASR